MEQRRKPVRPGANHKGGIFNSAEGKAPQMGRGQGWRREMWLSGALGSETVAGPEAEGEQPAGLVADSLRAPTEQPASCWVAGELAPGCAAGQGEGVLGTGADCGRSAMLSVGDAPGW